jgi:hypothetical protein
MTTTTTTTTKMTTMKEMVERAHATCLLPSRITIEWSLALSNFVLFANAYKHLMLLIELFQATQCSARWKRFCVSRRVVYAKKEGRKKRYAALAMISDAPMAELWL